ncbi:unnamed protein product [Prorocentrum cordatum]|uniref:DUF4326 domain-containing protein n=1 Tax=Prorocentrum cordatum TaxID=2364126 RepID=A0ABN9RMT0_9DINO|nr:unnamed protein product [Polarella glacialis]
MGSRRGHTVPCVSSSAAKSHPERYKALQRSLVGNSFQCEVVAWLLSHWPVHHSLLVAAVCEENLHLLGAGAGRPRGCWGAEAKGGLPELSAVSEAGSPDAAAPPAAASPAADAGRAPSAGAGPEARAIYVGRGSRRWGLGPVKWGNPCPVVPGRPAGDAAAPFAGWLRSQPELLDQLEELEGARLLCHCPPGQPCHADILLAELEQRGRGCPQPILEHQRTDGKMFPRREIDAGIWKWKVAHQLVWQDQAKHINVLECEAAPMALRWRARSVSRQMCVLLPLLDRVVSIASSSAFSIAKLALGSRAVFAFTSSAKNPADAPFHLSNA